MCYTDENDGYMAFGVSGADDSTSMDNGDVAVAYFKGDGSAEVKDYFLQSRALVSLQLLLVFYNIVSLGSHTSFSGVLSTWASNLPPPVTLSPVIVKTGVRAACPPCHHF